MKIKHILFAVAAMLLWAACAKKNKESSLPGLVVVDTVSLLTGNEWLWMGNGTDTNEDGLLDIGGITFLNANQVFTYYPDGRMGDTVYLDGTKLYNTKMTWKFVGCRARVDFILYDTMVVESIVIKQISDTNLIVQQLGLGNIGWRIYTKYVR